jgi:hypothetical protein
MAELDRFAGKIAIANLVERERRKIHRFQFDLVFKRPKYPVEVKRRKPLVNTKSCRAPHLQYHVSGRLAPVMDDGSKAEFGPGDVSLIPPGQDAWVVGPEPVVVVDITGMGEYAKPHAH